MKRHLTWWPKRDKDRTFLAYIALLGCALAFLIHFSMIAIYGGYYVYEHSRYVLGIEISMIIILAILAVERLVSMWKRRNDATRTID